MGSGNYADMIQSVNIDIKSVGVGEVGKQAPYFKYVTFPVVTEKDQDITAEGEMI